ncbi:fumarylacetoacetate hydrolase family protein [Ideonella azotifigens]|uniref:Fumarylacetoacetate hydrolase family protein n=1 Tax=Ideonella azotifigens TaxID=513160 RepID=A0ABN1JT04_9BURK|nr:fumarylacetoacetate hydrolase family protein [Ideonella azotifigens]MCD2340890.1 fumarylacetoacetate hydrolase family protein [Ideonella azotifigens]
MSLVFPAPAVITVPVAGASSDQFPVRRIYCVGRNYAEHAIEMGATGREPPFFFMKPADAILAVPQGETGHMAYPTLTHSLHHEVELVVAIGKGGKDISAEAAGEHIWGYAIGLDMTRRDLQNDMKKQGRSWEIGKAFEQSAPIGPLHPVASTGELTSGAITLEVNGELRQRGDLSDLIWNVRETIAVLSQGWELAPGDLIYTGTPAGVGAVKVGDTLRCEITGLGSLVVEIVAGA